MHQSLQSNPKMQKRLDPVAREIWDNMPPAKKKSFAKEAHELRGQLLQAHMYAVLRQEVQPMIDLVDTVRQEVKTKLDLVHTVALVTICGVKNMETFQSGFNAEDSHTKNERQPRRQKPAERRQPQRQKLPDREWQIPVIWI